MSKDTLSDKKTKLRGRTSRLQAPEIDPIFLANSTGNQILELAPERAVRYRHLHTRLTRETPLPKRLGIIAALRGAGVTRVSLELATVMAHDIEARFCVVETNFWWPRLATYTQVEASPGLSELVTGEKEADDVLHPTGLKNLWLLPAGQCEEITRSRLARSKALQAVLNDLDGQFDHLILDIPAILASDDAVPLASLADDLCLLVRQDATPVPLAKQALDQVEHLSICGVIMNGDKTSIPKWILNLVGGGQIR